MTDLQDRLERLGLALYLPAFIAEGFDTWETVVDITESDLTSLSVKLGHRRKLQRAIAEWRGQPSDAPLPNSRRRVSVDGSHRSDESGNEGRPARPRDPSSSQAPQSTKRKYRRHPKPDENAPDRPPSAYVIFSNQVRETLKGQELSFADIAKIVGERWQVLSPKSREACDRQAATAKEKYYLDFAEYKRTPQYNQYQAYLAEFKAKYNSTPAGREEGKRSKLEAETGGSGAQSATSNLEKLGRGTERPLESASAGAGHNRSTSTDPHDLAGSGIRYAPATDVSQASRSLTSTISPRVPSQPSPMSISPISSTAYREPLYLPPIHDHNLRERQAASEQGTPAYVPTINGSPPSFPPQYGPAHGSRRSHNGAPELKRAGSSIPSIPSLARTDTTLSSVSNASIQTSGMSGSASLPSLPSLSSIHPIDAPKVHRALPQPLLSPGNGLKHAETPGSGLPTRLASPPPPGHGIRSGLSTLLMATEMVGKQDRPPLPSDRPP